MDAPVLDFSGTTLSRQQEVVRVFYKELWDHADKSLIPELFHSDFTFRSSLGPTLVRHDGFAGYVDLVTSTFGKLYDRHLGHDRGPRVSGKVRFHGYHRLELFGVPANGRHDW